MTDPKHKHRPCPCGCGEMADECMKPSSGLNAFQMSDTQPGDRDDLVRVIYTGHGIGHTYRDDFRIVPL